MNLTITSFEEYQSKYKKSVENPEKFWADIASNFLWMKPWENVLDWEFKTPQIGWFKGAQLNITENCIDRYLVDRPNQTAILWESNFPDQASRAISYQELHNEVCRLSNALKSIGVGKGDRVCIYMPMIPELAFAVLACARIGAIHSVVFAGFSATAISDRINDAQCKVLLTADGLNRGDKKINLKQIVDQAVAQCPSIERVIVKKCLENEIQWNQSLDVWWDELIEGRATTCAPEPMDSEDTLFILYTSGSTGKPKGVQHSSGGYMVYSAYSFANVFQYEKGDIYWCTADIGWITGHSYIIYGPLLCGATTMMFEGIPTWPDAGRFWEIIDKHKVNQFYTAPTAIRALMACDDQHIDDKSLSSLKVLGTVGEPINEEAWHWYQNKVGKGKLPIVDTWWQTETGGIMISGLGGLSPQKPTFAGYPLPGVQPCLLDADGSELMGGDAEGYLCIKFPWPSMIRSTWGDHERCRITYFSHYKDMYFTGDGARRDSNGMYRIIGRVDDVINVSGHRFGTAEIENAINENIDVVESAVVGYPHAIKGQGIYAFVICHPFPSNFEEARKSILATTVKEIGAIAKPDRIQFVQGLPKTRSGKIMRRILRKIAEGDSSNLGDTSTLLDPSVVEEIIKGSLEFKSND